MKMIYSLALAFIFVMMLSAFGLFAAREQGPPGLRFFHKDAVDVVALGAVAVTALFVLTKHETQSRYERLQSSALELRAFCRFVNIQIRRFGEMMVRLILQSHFQTTRMCSFTA